MYVCICNAITEDMLEQATKHSANQTEILNKLGVGSSCGICLIEAIEKMNKTTQTKSQSVNIRKSNQTK